MFVTRSCVVILVPKNSFCNTVCACMYGHANKAHCCCCCYLTLIKNVNFIL